MVIESLYDSLEIFRNVVKYISKAQGVNGSPIDPMWTKNIHSSTARVNWNLRDGDAMHNVFLKLTFKNETKFYVVEASGTGRVAIVSFTLRQFSEYDLLRAAETVGLL